jgi:hypothetical protein
MAAYFWIVRACCIDGADAEGKVGGVSMLEAASPRAKIECG